MSAFVVDHATINRLLTAVSDDQYKREPMYGQLWRHFGQPTDAALEGLGVELLAMNQDAVMARYPDCAVGELPGPINPPAYAYRREHCSTVQAYKSARCLRYQCSEGDVPSTELYRQLDEATNIIAHAIVAAMPEYEAAAWD